jgi:hypothetical protein
MQAKKQPMDKRPRGARVPAIIVGVVVFAIAGLSIWYLVRPQPLLVQGEVDATRLDIAARVDGRVAEIPVVRGFEFNDVEKAPSGGTGLSNTKGEACVSVCSRPDLYHSREPGASVGSKG